MLFLTSILAVSCFGETAYLKTFNQAWYAENAQRNLNSAIKLYNQVAESAGQAGDEELESRAFLRIGLCYERLQKKDDALRAYQKALRLKKEDLKSFDAALAKLGSPAGQLINLDEFLSQLPEEIQKNICDHFYTRAETIQNDAPEQAIQIYRRAVQVSKFLKQHERAGFALSFIGDLFRRQGRFRDALKTYKEVETQFDKETAVLAWNYIRIAETFRLLNQPEDARKAYAALQDERFARQVQPRLWSQLWLGDTYRVMKDLENAKKTWSEMIEEETLPERIAKMLATGEPAIFSQEPEDPFANDVAYFIAVRESMAGNGDAAAEAHKQCIELSQGFDWPRQLAEQELKK